MILVAAAFARPPADGLVDSATHPIRCHHEGADPAQCEAVLEYAATAWDVQIPRGFRVPPSDGDEGGSESLDFYLGTDWTTEAGEAWVDCEGGDPNCTDADPGDGLAGAASYVVIDARTSDAVLEGYVAHELNHTFQYATDYAEPFLSVWEGTAVAAEVWTLGTADGSPVADYQATPWISAVLQDGYFLWDEYAIWSWYEYGAVTWVLWMEERYGVGTAPRLWEAMSQEGYADEPDVLDAWEELAGAPWEEEFLEFAVWRAQSGGDEVEVWGGEAAEAWREGTVDGDGTYIATMPVFPLGMAVWDVDVGCVGTVTVTPSADIDTRLEVRSTSVSSVDEECATYTTMMVANLGPEGFDADDPLEGATISLEVAVEPAPEEEVLRGCGCTTGGAPGAGLLALAALVGRRRR